MKKEPETLGDRLSRLREDKRLTQTQLAKLAGVGQSTVAGIESGARSTVPGSLIDIAHALGVDAYYLKHGVQPLIAGDKLINEVAELMKTTAKEGNAVILDKAREMAKQYPREDLSKLRKS
ncbi:MAG: XRE family transcriptional regulator [Rhodocyclaceae bacterium]|nr:XRE family transcriptional regulator [Rhodocyclaceae bacterium]